MGSIFWLINKLKRKTVVHLVEVDVKGVAGPVREEGLNIFGQKP